MHKHIRLKLLYVIVLQELQRCMEPVYITVGFNVKNTGTCTVGSDSKRFLIMLGFGAVNYLLTNLDPS